MIKKVNNCTNLKYLKKLYAKLLKTMMSSLFLLQLLLHLTVSSASLQKAPPIALHGCQDQCGDVKISYPFGIGAHCYLNQSYEITCNDSFHPPKPFLRRFNLEVVGINSVVRRDVFGSYEDQKLSVAIPFKNICIADGSDTQFDTNIDFRGTPFSISGTDNVFVVEGCGANLLLTNSSGDVVAGCSSICSSTAISMKILNCYGINCCHANLNTFYLDYYTIDVLNNATSSSRICNVAAGLINSSLLSNFVGNLSSLRKYSTVVLDWKVEYAAHKSPFPHSSCYDNTITNVQKCDCDFNYEGNPHIPDGCQCK
jgi:wall-associated receptor kinase-like protein with galacturonan-binding domain